MTIHYHGTDMPESVLRDLAGRCFCVSFLSTRKKEVQICHEIGQSVMLDNGAFSQWRSGKKTDWLAYYKWVEPWLDYPTTWAVIPDVIGGTDEDNDRLIDQWPHGDRGAPVWHMHERIDRLLRIADDCNRVCIGSSGAFATVGSSSWHGRMREAMSALCKSGIPPVWLHMLRGMSLAGSSYPFASVDSSDIARNHHRPQNTPRGMADRWDARQCAARWKDN